MQKGYSQETPLTDPLAFTVPRLHKNTLDIKSSTGIRATTSILNITSHDVIAVFPLKELYRSEEKRNRNSFKSKRQYFIYSKSTDGGRRNRLLRRLRF
jgi:hypothetical protein